MSELCSHTMEFICEIEFTLFIKSLNSKLVIRYLDLVHALRSLDHKPNEDRAECHLTGLLHKIFFYEKGYADRDW